MVYRFITIPCVIIVGGSNTPFLILNCCNIYNSLFKNGECMLIDIEEIKLHLRIDGDEENRLLEQYLLASIQDVELRTKRPLVSATDERAICSTDAELPAIIKQYLLLTIGDMYRNRENKQEKSYTTYFNHLLDAYIDYGA